MNLRDNNAELPYYRMRMVIVDFHSIFNRCKNYSDQQINVHEVNDVMG
jgi:hypothetical protein